MNFNTIPKELVVPIAVMADSVCAMTQIDSRTRSCLFCKLRTPYSGQSNRRTAYKYCGDVLVTNKYLDWVVELYNENEDADSPLDFAIIHRNIEAIEYLWDRQENSRGDSDLDSDSESESDDDAYDIMPAYMRAVWESHPDIGYDEDIGHDEVITGSDWQFSGNIELVMIKYLKYLPNKQDCGGVRHLAVKSFGKNIMVEHRDEVIEASLMDIAAIRGYSQLFGYLEKEEFYETEHTVSNMIREDHNHMLGYVLVWPVKARDIWESALKYDSVKIMREIVKTGYKTADDIPVHLRSR